MKNRNMSDLFKVKVEYEGQIITKEKVKGVKGLQSVFKKLEMKLR